MMGIQEGRHTGKETRQYLRGGSFLRNCKKFDSHIEEAQVVLSQENQNECMAIPL